MNNPYKVVKDGNFMYVKYYEDVIFKVRKTHNLTDLYKYIQLKM